MEAGTGCRLIPYKCVWLFAGGIFQTKFWCAASARQPCNPSSKQAVICFFVFKKKAAWKAALSLYACTNTHARAHVRMQASSRWAVAAFQTPRALPAAPLSFCSIGGPLGVQRWLKSLAPRDLLGSQWEQSGPTAPGQGRGMPCAASYLRHTHQHRTRSSMDTSIPGWSGQSHKSSLPLHYLSSISKYQTKTCCSPSPLPNLLRGAGAPLQGACHRKSANLSETTISGLCEIKSFVLH